MLLLAIDPNIYLAALLGHDFSLNLLSRLEEIWEYVQIAFDVDGSIEESYENILQHITIGQTNYPIPGSDEVVERFILQSLQQSPPIKLSTSITDAKEMLLVDLRCNTPIEPQLIAISAEPKFGCRLVVVGNHFKHPMISYRCTHDKTIVDKLRQIFPKLYVRDVLRTQRSLLDWIQKLLYPATQHDLECFLEDNPDESMTVEYKQSGVGYLTHSILEQTMREICAMANTKGGKVLIGITEKTEKEDSGRKIKNYLIDGFEPKYQGRKGKTKFLMSQNDVVDILYKDSKLLPKFEPAFNPEELQFNIIELDNNNWVLVIHVKQGQGIRCYGSSTYRREGTQSKKHPV